LRFLPLDLPPGLTRWLGLAELPGLGLERVLEEGFPGLKLDFGFQAGPAFLSAREAELGYGLALVGR